MRFGNYTLHQPDPLGPNGVQHPLLTWGDGGGTTPGFYSILPHLASHGFVVIAANTVPSIGAEDALGRDMLAGIDWLIEQNQADGELRLRYAAGRGHPGILLPPADAKIRAMTTAWFRYYLMNDQAWKSTFVGPDCTLCKDAANWKLLKKNHE